MAHYFPVHALRQQRDEFKKIHAHSMSYFVRSGVLLRELERLGVGGTAVELGTASGALAALLREKFFQTVLTVDVDDCRSPERMGADITFAEADVSREPLPLADASADAVIAMAVLEHLENPFFAIRDVARVVKPGGFFLFSLPHVTSFHSRLRFLRKGELESYGVGNNHIAVFTPAILGHALAGLFSIQRVIYSPGYLKLFGRKAPLAKFPRLGKYAGTKVMYVAQRLDTPALQ